MPKSIVLRRNALAWIRLLPLVFLAVFMSAPLAVPSNLAVAHVCSPRGKRDHAIHRLISVNTAHVRSPVAKAATELLIPGRRTRSLANGEGDYATELLICWTPHTLDRQMAKATTRLTD